MTEGETLGKYEIRRTLGRGAAGIVLEAWDPVIQRRVAIKTVRLDGTMDAETREQLDRFRREAQAAGQLVHPNIVTVHDYGETNSTAYIVMEYVEGPSLKTVLEMNYSLSRAEVVRIMEDMLAALSFSHQHGVIHRDIKPGNVMLTSRDMATARAKIADFGIARIESSTLTQAGTMMGTPAYMAPEQFLGEPIDTRSDIYAAGVVLYQLLTGQRPFEGSISSIMHQVLTIEARPPSMLVMTIDPVFDSVVMRAIAKRPVQRFQYAAAFAEALREAAQASQDGIQAAPESTIQQRISPRANLPAAIATPVPIEITQVEPARVRWSVVIAGVGLAGAVLFGGWLFLASLSPVGDGNWLATSPSDRTSVLAQVTPSPPASPSSGTLPSGTSSPDTLPPGTPSSGTAPLGTQSSATRPADPQPAGTQSAGPQPPDAQPSGPQPPASRSPAAPTAGAQPSGSPPVDGQSPNARPQAEPGATAQGPGVASQTATVTPAGVPSASTPLLAAIPPTPVFGPAERTALSRLVTATRCTLLDGATGADGALLRGLAGPGTEALVRRSLVEQRIAGRLDWQAKDANPVFCPTLDMLRVASPVFDTDGPRLRLTLAEDRTALREGDAIRPRIIMPAFSAYLYVDYLTHDGAVQHLFPQVADPRSGIKADPVRQFAPSEWVNLGDPAPGQRGWEASEPFGRDMIITIATSQPLFAAARATNAEAAEPYLRALATAMSALRQGGGQAAATAIAVQVMPR